MRKILTRLLFLFALFLSHLTFSQSKELAKFILPGYEIRDTLCGDLNADGRMDVLLILKALDEDTLPGDKVMTRPLLILIRQADGNLKLEARNDDAVLCKQCGGAFGDPYTNMVITGDYFSVEHYGGSSSRWTDIVTFKYNPSKKNWFLHKWGGEVINNNYPESNSNWLKTTKEFGVVLFEKFNRDGSK